ncbi:MAG: hypothetical protein IT338_04780 [Thermomicrobiales bacterium]|nr:hypothetical protein [Thermomicrobiales bacterium]
MTTRADLRISLRLRLEDSGSDPLWDDATLDAAIAAAIRAYGAAFPRQVTAGVAVPAGAKRVATGLEIEPGGIARVLDAAGIWVPPWPAGPERDGERGQAWRWWGGDLVLAEPAAASGAGIWTIEHRAGREPPATDGEAIDVIPGDEEIVLGLAASAALTRRAVEDAKRGARGHTAALAAAARQAADALIARRKRRVRG